MVNQHGNISYVEFAAGDLIATKHFFEIVFQWQFTDYGEDYTAFSERGVAGGFYRADLQSSVEQGGALIVLYSEELEQTEQDIVAGGGRILKPIFSFPGGRRFHFIEPSGNELAVWSDC